MIAEPDQGPNQPKYVLPLLQLIQVSAAIQVTMNTLEAPALPPELVQQLALALELLVSLMVSCLKFRSSSCV
jgi:hypothetical protein